MLDCTASSLMDVSGVNPVRDGPNPNMSQSKSQETVASTNATHSTKRRTRMVPPPGLQTQAAFTTVRLQGAPVKGDPNVFLATRAARSAHRSAAGGAVCYVAPR